MLRAKRIYRGVAISGRRRYLRIKLLHPNVRAIRAGIWQIQIGRLLIRVASTLADGRYRC